MARISVNAVARAICKGNSGTAVEEEDSEVAVTTLEVDVVAVWVCEEVVEVEVKVNVGVVVVVDELAALAGSTKRSTL